MKKLFAFLSIFLLSVSLLSCNKRFDDIPDPKNNKLVEISVRTENLIEKPMLKSLDINSWVYNYNPNQYSLTFTGKYNTYTFVKSIQELQTGFNVSICPDTYTITYQTEHSGILSTTLDISINDTKSITGAGELLLNAQHTDFLIILDNGGKNANMLYQGSYNTNLFRVYNENSELLYSYGYYNVEGDISIKYQNEQGQLVTNTIYNAKVNNVYHIVKGINGTSSINIVPFSYNNIAW